MPTPMAPTVAAGQVVLNEEAAVVGEDVEFGVGDPGGVGGGFVGHELYLGSVGEIVDGCGLGAADAHAGRGVGRDEVGVVVAAAEGEQPVRDQPLIVVERPVAVLPGAGERVRAAVVGVGEEPGRPVVEPVAEVLGVCGFGLERDDAVVCVDRGLAAEQVLGEAEQSVRAAAAGVFPGVRGVPVPQFGAEAARKRRGRTGCPRRRR
ncbi:hypothetical protein [Amycolatopsis rubida]|uniref:hypothetical protein n=1 Tax=Amycolatopsis rubida TaxID=112413 RepID=UPI000B87C63B|nr:hypothetical protein [Amycolatopsis rubida]